VRILFLTHYFPPEVNAPATRTYEHCVRWVRAGHEVTVVTCAPNCPDGLVYEGYRNKLPRQVEWVDGIRVVRVWTYLAPNAGTGRRILNYLSYMVSATLAAVRLRRPDVVVATSPQFFCGWAGVFASWLKWRPLLLEIRDIWPESIAAVGAIRRRWLLRLLERLEKWMYRSAAHVVAVGAGYRRNILKKVRMADRVSVIPNGVDLEEFVPDEPYPRLLHKWNLEDRFVCSYVGTVGMAHGLEVVLDAAELLRDKGRRDIGFVIVGDGADRRRLEEEAARRGLNGAVVFTGREPKEEIPAVLASSDACLIHLKQCELFGTVIPSKIFETMAMGRPIIMGVNGEARRIVMEAGAGVPMEPESARSLVEALEYLADRPGSGREVGHRARQYVARHYDRGVLAGRYLGLLERVAAGDGRGSLIEPLVTAEHAGVAESQDASAAEATVNATWDSEQLSAVEPADSDAR